MIVLASRSPRRKHLLEMLGIECTVEPAGIEEVELDGETPEETAVRLAREKAVTVARRHPGTLVLGADTIVVLDGRQLGKPGSPEDAQAMLQDLEGGKHTVVTAVSLARDGRSEELVDATDVWLRKLSAGEIADYVATGEPLDKAGAYGIQGKGAVLIDRIEGDYFVVVGLPVRLVVELLRRAGSPYSFTR